MDMGEGDENDREKDKVMGKTHSDLE